MADQKNETQHNDAVTMSPQQPVQTINVKEPRFLGMRGKMLSMTVSVVATTGFLRKRPSDLVSAWLPMLTFARSLRL